MLARQMPDAEKRRRAHFVIETDDTLEITAKQVEATLRALAGVSGGR
jgi:dephospho-CoA kinase